MTVLESMPWWLFILTFIGICVCILIIAVVLTKELWEYVECQINGAKYKRKMKRRFDSPPLAKCEASMTPDEFQAYCKGNVMKYIWRYKEKNGLEDLKKARVYLEWMIESKEKES